MSLKEQWHLHRCYMQTKSSVQSLSGDDYEHIVNPQNVWEQTILKTGLLTSRYEVNNTTIA